MNIKPTQKSFVGKSLEIEEIFNQEIIVHYYEIGPSKFPEKGNGKCLKMQIEYEGRKRVVFTGSGVLMDQIEQVEESKFPFKTIIVKNDKRFEFT